MKGEREHNFNLSSRWWSQGQKQVSYCVCVWWWREQRMKDSGAEEREGGRFALCFQYRRNRALKLARWHCSYSSIRARPLRTRVLQKVLKKRVVPSVFREQLAFNKKATITALLMTRCWVICSIGENMEPQHRMGTSWSANDFPLILFFSK